MSLSQLIKTFSSLHSDSKILNTTLIKFSLCHVNLSFVVAHFMSMMWAYYSSELKEELSGFSCGCRCKSSSCHLRQDSLLTTQASGLFHSVNVTGYWQAALEYWDCLTLKRKAMSSEPSVTIYWSTQCNIPENLKLQQHRYENLRSRQIHHYSLLTSHAISWLKLGNLQCMNK